MEPSPTESGGLALVRGGWTVEETRGRAGEMHVQSADRADGSGGPVRRTVRVLQPERPALVLGSTQPAADVDEVAAARVETEVVRRRSGGGAVLVGPGEVVWVDFLIGVGDRLWDPDVGRAAWWVGDLWAAALHGAGVGGAARVGGVAGVTVWRGAMQATRWSRSVCFAGIGPGEVLIGKRKVVGVSQRRTRGAVLFQTAALLRWEPARLLDLLALDSDDRVEARTELEQVAAGVGVEAADRLQTALLAALMP